MKQIYMHPKIDPKDLQSPNPYVENLEKALSSQYKISNQKPNNLGVVDMYLHFFKSDAYFFNWIEYLPKQKFGKLQTLLFVVLIVMAKLFGKKIIWVLHNKYSHTKLAHSDGISSGKKFLFEFMIRQSDLIFTHSNSGVEFIREKFPTHGSKVKYVIHPIDGLYISDNQPEIKYDLLLWGTIHPYKGIIEFLEYASNAGKLSDLRILILGICPDKQLMEKLNRFLSENIVHHNRFYDFSEIADYTHQSRFVLFTYNSDSVLSSGSLMDSISMGASVIGPDRGAFRDLSNHSFIDVFETYDQIFEFLEKPDKLNYSERLDEIVEFCEVNSWNNFIQNTASDFRKLFNE